MLIQMCMRVSMHVHDVYMCVSMHVHDVCMCVGMYVCVLVCMYAIYACQSSLHIMCVKNLHMQFMCQFKHAIHSICVILYMHSV